MDPQIVIPNFELNEISTKTVIATSNLKFDIELMYEYLPITDYIVQKKKRGRKKKCELVVENKYIAPGSIISIQYRGKIRGAVLKSKKKGNEKYFRNSITLVLMLDNNKIINLKLSNNGKFQITGCKEDEQYTKCVGYIYAHTCATQRMTGEELVALKVITGINKNPKFVFNVVMKNVDFKIGFPIHREKLNSFFHINTEFSTFFEGCIVTGVIIKIKSKNPHDTYLDCLEIMPDGKNVVYKVVFNDYLEFHDEKERKKEMRKEKNHTFLCFGSGSCIQSGCGGDMPEIFTKFMKIVLENRAAIEETVIIPQITS